MQILRAKFGLFAREHWFAVGMVRELSIHFKFVLAVTMIVSRLQSICMCEMSKNINVDTLIRIRFFLFPLH